MASVKKEEADLPASTIIQTSMAKENSGGNSFPLMQKPTNAELRLSTSRVKAISLHPPSRPFRHLWRTL